MRKIRIAHLLGGGILCGAAQYVMKIMEGLEGERFSFHLVSLKDGPLAREARRRGLPVTVLGKTRTGDPRSLVQLIRLLHAREVDLVHTHTSNSNFYGILAGRFCPGCRPVVTLHAYYKDVNQEVVRHRALLRPGYRMDLFLLGRAERIMTVSRSIKDRVEADGFERGRIQVVPNGIDVQAYGKSARRDSMREAFGVGRDEVFVGTAGRLAWVKNQALFLRAAARAAEREKSLRFIVFGEGPEEGNLRGTAEELGIASRVIFAGWRDDLAACLSALDLFVLSSRSEVAPFVLLESMALQVPVIATNTGGIPEMMQPGVSGFLTGPESEQEMADRMVGLARDADFRIKVGMEGRRFVEKSFSEKKMMQSVADFYTAAFRAAS